jgi:cyclopropane-fatty-acyl-phospholipid synthase
VSATAERVMRDLLRRADVEIDGGRPFDIVIRDRAAFAAFARDGLAGVRNAYVEGLWETERLDDLTARFLRSGVEAADANRWTLLSRHLLGVLLNRQLGARGREARRHYDLGNDLFLAMLDPRMIYSCAYWRDASDLAAAQEAKLDLVCRKIKLRPGMRLLDIGCGWGGLARFAAERYGVDVVAITISEQQAELARENCRGLPVEVRLQDYRDLPADERYDAIASIGMFEHVGHKNYRRYLAIARRCLRGDGVFLLHTIGGSRSRTFYDPWFDDNIFPNTHLPSARQIMSAAEGLFILEDWENFGADYDRTLMAWFANFERAWPSLRAAYPDKFYRLWKCFLLTSAGAFRARYLHTWQLVLSVAGVPGGYRVSR